MRNTATPQQALRQHRTAVATAVFAAAIWSSTFVLVKMVLPYVGPLTVAALRYFLAFLLLLPVVMVRHRRGKVTLPASRHLWGRLCALGLCAYAIGNGALFWGLHVLPATTVSFLMNLNPVFVLLGGLLWLKEVPSRRQVWGLFVVLSGSILFFTPGFQTGELLAIAVVFVGLAGFTAFGLLGRGIARDREMDTLTLTTIPLGFGGGMLLIVALLLEGVPKPPPLAWSVILWLAAVNTAAGYALYNSSLQRLTALETNVILDLAPLGTALLAWLLLGEALAPIRIGGMVIVILGVVLVQTANAHEHLERGTAAS